MVERAVASDVGDPASPHWITPVSSFAWYRYALSAGMVPPAQTEPPSISIWGRMQLGWLTPGDDLAIVDFAYTPAIPNVEGLVYTTAEGAMLA